jgi:protocatechuate 3,4-dioxygenase beta subunit
VIRRLAILIVVTALSAAAALAATGAPSACPPTVSDAAGPFSQSGIKAPRRAKIGTGHVLNGRVVGAGDCRPVSGALVVLWQAGPNGYGPRGRGSVRTDRQGRFRFQGPVPTDYGRGAHIHIAVIHPQYEELLTRHVVRSGATVGRIRIALTPLL